MARIAAHAAGRRRRPRPVPGSTAAAAGRAADDVPTPAGAAEQLLGVPAHSAPGNSTPRPIRLAEQLIIDHAHEMLTVTDVAEAVGLSVRSLQEGFRRYLDTTPTARLREARLVGVHNALAAADPTKTTVAAVAADWGFWHLGRFSALYRRRWGVPPSVTLRA
ncbi:helix-turn-helix transcriptional regulator [Nocardia sp. NPDC019302]|uniref:helix-turn-helix transcriptional regulator n=1 Tax=Nocardia sp. NPDC019302 TaxID=3154592 RepID=UPI0033D3731F